jgi:dipeptidyl aminopeptidase/acylaminoacyl peptidase
VTKLCVINTQSKTISDIVTGADFYAAPCFTPDGSRLAWLEWYHPDMPWEGAELRIADVSITEDHSDLALRRNTYLAGAKRDVSVAYPFWSPDGSGLFFTSDAGDLRFQNPWMYKNGTVRPTLREEVAQEFGAPAWLLGWSYGAVIDHEGEHVLFVAVKEGRSILHLVNTSTNTSTEIESPYVDILDVRRVGTNKVVFLGKKANEPAAVVLCSFESGTSFETLKTTASAEFGPELISLPRAIELKVPPNQEPLHVVYYAPKNPQYSGSSIEGEKPPCVVSIHGGPTAKETQALVMTKQYFTSRGWGWVCLTFQIAHSALMFYTVRCRLRGIIRLRARLLVNLTIDFLCRCPTHVAYQRPT